MQEASGSNLCNSGEFTYFSGELWWIFVRSALTLAVNLHNFTAFTAFHRKIMYKICGKKTNFCNFFSTRDHSWVDLDTGSRKFEDTVYLILREFRGIYFGYNNATIVTFRLFFRYWDKLISGNRVFLVSCNRVQVIISQNALFCFLLRCVLGIRQEDHWSVASCIWMNW